MSRRTVLLVALLLVGAAVVPFAGLAAEQVVGKPTVELFAPNNELSPGTDATLQVQLANEGELTRAGPSQYVERVTTARATTIEVTSGETPIEVNTDRYAVGTVPQGTAGPIPIDVTVPADTPVGTYQLPVRVRYVYTRIVDYGGNEVEYTDSTYDRVQELSVRVTRSPRFEIVDREANALIGDEGTLSVTLRNVGSQDARDARVEVASRSDELTFGTGSTTSDAFVGAWPAGATRTVNYSVHLADAAEVRRYPLDLAVAYKGPDGIAGEDADLRTSLLPIGEQRFSLADVSANVRVGEDGTLTGAVVNEGPRRAASPVVVLSIDNQHITVSESEYAVDDLAPGERASFDFDVEVSDSASAGSRQFALTLRYRNADDETRESDELVTRVDVAPSRDQFEVEPVAAELPAGGSDTVTLRVTNAGDEPVTDVSAKVFASSPLSTSDDEAFVAGLEPGETTELTFGLAAGAGALEKTYPVQMDFQYDTTDGDTELSRTYRFPVAVTVSESGGGGLPLIPIAVAALVVVGVGAYLLRRRRRE